MKFFDFFVACEKDHINMGINSILDKGELAKIDFFLEKTKAATVRIAIMDALLFAINLEVMLLQMRISETSAGRKLPNLGVKNKREKQLCDKFTRDLKIVKEVTSKTLIELVDGGVYHMLKHAVNILENNVNAGVLLRTRYERLKTSLENVKIDLQRNRQQWTLDLRNSDLKIAHLRDNIKDNEMNSRIRYDYADKWLCARLESLELQMQPQPILAPKLEHEVCVHNELVKAYELQIQRREQLLEYWKSRFAKDTACLEKQLATQCEKLRITVVRRSELEALFKLHEGEMRAWLTFKKERAIRLAREERLRKAATRIQAWWRGVMVRRALGTFRYLRNTKKTAPKSKKK